MRLELLRAETETSLRGLSDYQANMEKQLVALRKEEQAKALAKMENIDSDRDFPNEYIYEEYTWAYEFTFSRYLRYSFIVLLVLTLEYQLTNLCNEISECHGLHIKVNDLRIDTIGRFKKYLRDFAGISSIEELWERIEDLFKVRNCIAHGAGNIHSSRNQERLRNLVTKSTTLFIGADNQSNNEVLIITPEFCTQAINDVRKLVEAVFKSTDLGLGIL
jgi:hypothetical protein